MPNQLLTRLRKIKVGLKGDTFYSVDENRILPGIDGRIVDIICDEEYFKNTKQERYLVIVRDEKTGTEYVWKRITNMPVEEEFSRPQQSGIEYDV